MQSDERPDLNALVEKWLPILRLEDWNVTAKYASKSSIKGYGKCSVSMHLNRADIEIAEPSDIPDDEREREGNSVEATLVHELRHISCGLFRPKKRKSLRHTLFERFVDMDSIILVRLQRRIEELEQKGRDEGEH